MEGSIYDRGGVMVSDKERSKEEVLFARTSLAKSYNLRAGNQMFGQPKVLLSFGTLVQIICSKYQIKVLSKPIQQVYSDRMGTFWVPKNMQCPSCFRPYQVL